MVHKALAQIIFGLLCLQIHAQTGSQSLEVSPDGRNLLFSRVLQGTFLNGDRDRKLT